MTNFDFLKSDPQFATFSDVAISAEKILNIDVAASVLNCRRAMEFAVKWMYSVDKDLEMPYDTTLITLMSSEEFRDVVGNDCQIFLVGQIISDTLCGGCAVDIKCITVLHKFRRSRGNMTLGNAHFVVAKREGNGTRFFNQLRTAVASFDQAFFFHTVQDHH